MLQGTFRMISFIMASVTMFTVFSTVPGFAASKKPKLVSHVEKQEYNKDTKEWETTRSPIISAGKEPRINAGSTHTETVINLALTPQLLNR